MLRLLASFSIIEETGEERWKPTRVSSELADPEGFLVQLMLTGFVISSFRLHPSNTWF